MRSTSLYTTGVNWVGPAASCKNLRQQHLFLFIVALVTIQLPVVESFGSTLSSSAVSWKPQQTKSRLDPSAGCWIMGRQPTTIRIIPLRLLLLSGGAGGDTATAQQSEDAPPPPPPTARRRPKRVNETVRAIMDLLTTKYDSTEPGNNTSTTSRSDWDKMRRYLYRATAPSSSSSTQSSPSRQLTLQQVRHVVTYLDQELFPGRTHLQRSVLQTSPRILSRHVQTQLQPTVAFLQSLYPHTSTAVVVVWDQAIVRNPDLLLTTGTGYQNYHNLDLVQQYLRHDLQLPPPQLEQLQRTTPLLFQTSMTQLLSVVSFFQNILSLPTIDPDEETTAAATSASSLATIRRLLVSHPQLFQLSVVDNLQPRLDYLQRRCHLSDTDVAQLLQQKTSSASALLGLSVRENLQPTLDLLSELLLLRPCASEEEEEENYNNHNHLLRRTILQHPQILGLSLSNLRAKIAYFDSLDEHRHDNNNTNTNSTNATRLSSRILIRSPAVYSLSLRDNIVPTIEYLAQIWGAGTSHNSTDWATLLLEYPSILTLSLTRNLQPTVAFYQHAGYYYWPNSTLATAAAATTDHQNPSDDDPQRTRNHGILRGRYLAASLYQRLLPRWHYYQNQPWVHAHNRTNTANILASSSAATTTTTTSNNNNRRLPLHVLAGASDAEFCRYVGVELSHYVQFHTEAVPRLKFSSQFDTWVRTGAPIDVV